MTGISSSRFLAFGLGGGLSSNLLAFNQYNRFNLLSSLLSTFRLLLLLISASSVVVVTADDNGHKTRPSPKGYITYCPCMGRFGNQADHFLGVLRFAKELDRVLVLPPWIEYNPNLPSSQQIPFDKYFKIAPLERYHDVIPMEKFMAEIAPQIWPKHQRVAFCWAPRKSFNDKGDLGCHPKDGNPFGPFWDYSKIDFVDNEYYGQTVGGDPHDPETAERWEQVYHPSRYPVLAFTGAPASFPVNDQNRQLHGYLEWSEQVSDDAQDFIHEKLPEGPFIGIHLRNDRDWDNVCKHVIGKNAARQIFSSPQCLGYNNEFGEMSEDLCNPPKETIVKQVVGAVKKYKAKSVFVASDRDHMIGRLNSALKPLGVKAYKQEDDNPHVSLAILGRSKYYIGNCLSSFSAFAKRERDAKGLPSGFWTYGDSSIRRNKKSKQYDDHSHVKHSEL